MEATIAAFAIVAGLAWGDWMQWKSEGKLPPKRIDGIGRIVEVRG